MMNVNKVFRENARKQLGGGIFQNNWLMAMLVCLIYMAIMSFASSFIVMPWERVFSMRPSTMMYT